MAGQIRYGTLDRDQQERLATRYYGYAIHCVARRLRHSFGSDEDTVTTIAHDALMTATRTYNEQIPFTPWLATKCRYAVLDHLKARSPRKVRIENATRITRQIEENHCARLDSSLEHMSRNDDVSAVMAQIAPEGRAVARAISNGATIPDICAQYGITKAKVYWTLGRCRAAIERKDDDVCLPTTRRSVRSSVGCAPRRRRGKRSARP